MLINDLLPAHAEQQTHINKVRDKTEVLSLFALGTHKPTNSVYAQTTPHLTAGYGQTGGRGQQTQGAGQAQFGAGAGGAQQSGQGQGAGYAAGGAQGTSTQRWRGY